MAEQTKHITGIYSPDNHGFSCLFEAYYSRLCFFASNIIQDKTSAEDLVQSSFMQLWMKRKSIDWEVSVVPYLYTIVRHAAYHYLRDQKNTDGIEEEMELPDDADFIRRITETETLREIYNAIQALPARRRNVFTALLLEEKTVAEIAAFMNISASTVRSQKAAAIAFLRGQVEWLIVFLFTYYS